MPNLFLDISGTIDRMVGRKRDAAGQGQRFLTGEIGQKVSYVPCKIGDLSTSQTLVSPKGVRLFIDGIRYSFTNTAATTGTEGRVDASVTGSLARVHVIPSVANTVWGYVKVGVLLQENETISVVFSNGERRAAQVFYREVLTDDS